ncbi:MAG: pilus assembly protein [Butyrivibrio sp.]|nr:pilus assembly protein [Butyrivibrio sp.]
MKRYKGYMTLEASLLMPMVICILVLLIYFSYYLYGRCIISEDAYILAFRASVSDKGGTSYDPEGYVAEKASEVAGKKYFGNQKPVFEPQVNGKDVRVVGRSNTRHRAMGGYFLKPKGSWGFEAAGRATKRKYTRHIRLFTRLSDLGKELIDLGD